MSYGYIFLITLTLNVQTHTAFSTTPRMDEGVSTDDGLSTDEPSICESEWTYFKGACYRRYPIARPFNYAKSYCETAAAVSGHLTSVQSQLESDFITGLIREQSAGAGETFIGIDVVERNNSVNITIELLWLFDGSSVLDGYSTVSVGDAYNTNCGWYMASNGQMNCNSVKQSLPYICKYEYMATTTATATTTTATATSTTAQPIITTTIRDTTTVQHRQLTTKSQYTPTGHSYFNFSTSLSSSAMVVGVTTERNTTENTSISVITRPDKIIDEESNGDGTNAGVAAGAAVASILAVAGISAVVAVAVRRYRLMRMNQIKDGSDIADSEEYDEDKEVIGQPPVSSIVYA